jgi:hypothetical protein
MKGSDGCCRNCSPKRRGVLEPPQVTLSVLCISGSTRHGGNGISRVSRFVFLDSPLFRVAAVSATSTFLRASPRSSFYQRPGRHSFWWVACVLHGPFSFQELGTADFDCFSRLLPSAFNSPPSAVSAARSIKVIVRHFRGRGRSHVREHHVTASVSSRRRPIDFSTPGDLRL